jgi:hypothetical protein
MGVRSVVVGLATLVLVSLARPALAVPVTFEIDGTIGSIGYGALSSTFQIGSSVLWTLSFDTSSTPAPPSETPFPGTYNFPNGAPNGFAWSATIGDWHYNNSTIPGGLTILRVNPSAGRLSMDTSLSGRAVVGDVAGGIWYPVAFDAALLWLNPLGSVTLPSSAPTNGGDFTLYLSTNPQSFTADGAVLGRFTSARVVPEPSTLVLVLLGSAALFRRRQRS